jgi:hypothetical protein
MLGGHYDGASLGRGLTPGLCPGNHLDFGIGGKEIEAVRG